MNLVVLFVFIFNALGKTEIFFTFRFAFHNQTRKTRLFSYRASTRAQKMKTLAASAQFFFFIKGRICYANLKIIFITNRRAIFTRVLVYNSNAPLVTEMDMGNKSNVFIVFLMNNAHLVWFRFHMYS